MEIPPAEFIKECLNPAVVVTSFSPCSTERCESGHGIADTFTNKLQGKECKHCSEIYDAAKEREEAGEGEQAYDIHVARSLCSDA